MSDSDNDTTIAEHLANLRGVASKRQIAAQLHCRPDSREVELAHARLQQGLSSDLLGIGRPINPESAPDGRSGDAAKTRRKHHGKGAYQTRMREEAAAYWSAVNSTSQAKTKTGGSVKTSCESSPWEMPKTSRRKMEKFRLPDGTWYQVREGYFSINDLASYLGCQRATLKKYIPLVGIPIRLRGDYLVSEWHAKLLIGFVRSMSYR